MAKPKILIFDDDDSWSNKLREPLNDFEQEYEIVDEKDHNNAAAIITNDNCAIAILNVITNPRETEEDNFKNWKALMSRCKDRVAVIAITEGTFTNSHAVSLFWEYQGYELRRKKSFYPIIKKMFNPIDYKSQVGKFIDNLKSTPKELSQTEKEQLKDLLTKHPFWQAGFQARRTLLQQTYIPETRIQTLSWNTTNATISALMVIEELEDDGILAHEQNYTSLGSLIHTLYRTQAGLTDKRFCAEIILKNNLILDHIIILELNQFLDDLNN